MKVLFVTLAEAVKGVPGIPQDFIFNALVTHLDHYARGEAYVAAYCICEHSYPAEYNVNAADITGHWVFDRERYETCLINVALKPEAFALNLLALARAGDSGNFNAMYLLNGETVRDVELSSHLSALMRLPQTQAGWDHYVRQQRNYRGVIEVLSKLS